MLNEILGVGARFQQVLTRKFGILGGAPSPQLTPEISPHFDMVADPENRILAQELLCTGFQFVTAVVAKKSVAQLSNPAGSNTLLVLAHVRGIPVAGASNIRFGIGFNAPLVVGGGQRAARDTRRANIGGTPNPGVGVLSADTDPATIFGGNCFYQPTAAANLPVDFEESVILAPGGAFQVSLETVNLALASSWIWREVPLAPGEVGPF